MTVTYLPPDVLKKKVFDLVGECREKLASGQVDLSEVETSVKAYCESIASLSLEEGMKHRKSLRELMEAIMLLENELKSARDTVVGEVKALESMRRASKAYYNNPSTLHGTPDSNDE